LSDKFDGERWLTRIEIERGEEEEREMEIREGLKEWRWFT
jgi:hypothetical protein